MYIYTQDINISDCLTHHDQYGKNKAVRTDCYRVQTFTYLVYCKFANKDTILNTYAF